MLGRDVPPYEQWPIKDEAPPPFAHLERTWATQAEQTGAAIGSVADWDAPIHYTVTDDAGKRKLVTCSAPCGATCWFRRPAWRRYQDRAV